MSERPLRLDARCPVCGTPPAVRVYPRELEQYEGRDPDEPVMTVQCQQCMRTRRISVYTVTVAAYHGAA